MIGILFWARLLFALTPVGQVVKLVSFSTNAATAFMNEIEVEVLEDHQKKGINLAEEVFAYETYGTTEPLLPMRVVLEDLPQGFEKYVGHGVCGEVLWKFTEWNDFWSWVDILLYNSTPGQIKPLCRDGLWLVATGRERWADESMRQQALVNGEKYKEILKMRGMWKEQSSS